MRCAGASAGRRREDLAEVPRPTRVDLLDTAVGAVRASAVGLDELR